LRKGAVRKLLEIRDRDGVRAWGRRDSQALRTLSSMLFETDVLMRWRAIEAMGIVAAEISRNNSEAVRRLIRRLLWLMNDESGGLCWHAPEALAEILHGCDSSFDEFREILLSFLHEEPFEVGSRLAVARLAEYYRGQSRRIEPELRPNHRDRTAEITLASLLALKALGLKFDEQKSQELAELGTELQAYNFTTGGLVTVTAAGLAKLSLPELGYGGAYSISRL
jgi:hypothetical protein